MQSLKYAVGVGSKTPFEAIPAKWSEEIIRFRVLLKGLRSQPERTGRPGNYITSEGFSPFVLSFNVSSPPICGTHGGDFGAIQCLIPYNSIEGVPHVCVFVCVRTQQVNVVHCTKMRLKGAFLCPVVGRESSMSTDWMQLPACTHVVDSAVRVIQML